MSFPRASPAPSRARSTTARHEPARCCFRLAGAVASEACAPLLLPHCDSDDRRARSDRELVRGRRRAYAPDATGRAEWRFCCWSGATVCNIAGTTAFRRQSGRHFHFRIRADRRGAESRRPAPLGHETRCGEHPLAGGVGREPWSRPCRLRCRRFFDQRHVVIIRGRGY